jgi:hypothetical protein
MPRGKSVGLSISDLERMLSERRTSLQKLMKQRTEAQRKLNAIDKQIEKLGGNGAVRRGGAGSRVRNEVSLVAAIESALKKGDALGVGDIVDAVRASGYRSNSANFRGIVNQTLIKERKRFTSPSRGMYQLKK